MARNPNPTTVAATRPKRRRVAATVVGLGFLDTALWTGNQDGEPRVRTKTKNGERRIRKDKDGEKESVKKFIRFPKPVYPISEVSKTVYPVSILNVKKTVYPVSETL